MGQLTGTPSQRIVSASEQLAKAGFLTPPIALVGALGKGRYFVFTERVPGESVEKLLDKANIAGDTQRTNRLLAQLGKCVGQLHCCGFLHGNLRIQHILAKETPSGFRFTFLDTQELARRRPASGRALLGELSSLSHSATRINGRQQARFFSAWARQMCEMNATETKILATSAYKGCTGAK